MSICGHSLYLINFFTKFSRRQTKENKVFLRYFVLGSRPRFANWNIIIDSPIQNIFSKATHSTLIENRIVGPYRCTLWTDDGVGRLIKGRALQASLPLSPSLYLSFTKSAPTGLRSQ